MTPAFLPKRIEEGRGRGKEEKDGFGIVPSLLLFGTIGGKGGKKKERRGEFVSPHPLFFPFLCREGTRQKWRKRKGGKNESGPPTIFPLPLGKEKKKRGGKGKKKEV